MSYLRNAIYRINIKNSFIHIPIKFTKITLQNRPFKSTINEEIKKFSGCGHPQKNIDFFYGRVVEEPIMSISQRSQQVGLNETTT